MRRLIQRRKAACMVVVMLLGGMAWSSQQATAQSADSENSVIIVSLQTGAEGDASAEGVGLRNLSSHDIDLSGWKLQYQSATGTTWATKVLLSGSVSPGLTGYVVTASYQASGSVRATFAAGLSGAGGHIRILKPDSSVADILGWGTAAQPAGQSAPAPAPSQHLLRAMNTDGTLMMSANNAQDFYLEPLPNPPAPPPLPMPPFVASPAPQPPSPPSASVKTSSLLLAAAARLRITELLPNPAAPESDADAEYAEIYNSGTEAIELTGFRLDTGVTYSNTVSLKGLTVPAGGYLLVTSGTMALSLANTAGAARLRDPGGKVIFETAAYDKAVEGTAWAEIGGVWQWTSRPTPAAPNVAAAVAGAQAEDDSSQNNMNGSSAGGAPSKGSSAPSGTKKSGNSLSSDTVQGRMLHPLILAVVGLCAVGYAIYEYRHDMAHLYRKLRPDRDASRADRSFLKGRRDS